MNIKKFLPKEESTVFIKTEVSTELLAKVNVKRGELKLTWRELQEAMYKAFLDEMKDKRK